MLQIQMETPALELGVCPQLSLSHSNITALSALPLPRAWGHQPGVE